MELGNELRRLRKHRRLTLAEVGKATRLSVSFLSDMERGRTKPSLDTLEKLATYYQMSVNDILKETGFETTVYPPGYEEFLEEVGGSVDGQMEDLIFRAENRSKRRANTKEDWLKLYYSLKAILGE